MKKNAQRFYYKGSLLKQLKAFCAAARTGSISTAAETLYLSQPSVSLQIRALENEYNCVLFERRGRSIQLTRDGEVLFEMARPLIEGLDSLASRFNRKMQDELEIGEVNIAAGESTIMYILPALVQRFRNNYPNIHVHLHNVTGRDGMDMIRSDQVDFAIGSMLDVPSDIQYQSVYAFAPTLITPLEHPLAAEPEITLQDLSPYGLILPPRRLTTWRLIDQTFQRHNVPYNVSLEVGGWEVIKRYVELGFGISIVTSICLRQGDQLATKDMSRYFPRRSYGIVSRRGKFLSPQAQAFLDTIEQHTRDSREPNQQQTQPLTE